MSDEVLRFADALVLTHVGSVDDGRIDQLRSKIAELLQCEPSDSVRQRVRQVLLERGVTSHDFRVLAASVRLLGAAQWGSAVAPLAPSLLRHAEPLVRHATLACLVEGGLPLQLSVWPEWNDVLLDDSVHVQRQAQLLFAQQLVLVRDPICFEALRHLLQGEADPHTARAVIGAVGCVVALSHSETRALEEELHPVERLVRKCVLAPAVPLELRLVCEVVNAAWRRDGGAAARPELLEAWLQVRIGFSPFVYCIFKVLFPRNW